MIELRALGALNLRGSDGNELRAVLTQPKRLALLTYLALANSHGFRRRDTIVALFWPEMDQEHARNALRQAVWFLRRALGDGVVLGRGEDELGVSEEHLGCDATAFERACAAGRPAEALELYRGDFLEGFFVSEAGPELEHWVEEERARLRRLAGEAAWALAEQQRVAGDHSAAAEWGRKAAAMSPDDERAMRQLIVLLDQLGDRAGALRAYEEFATRLSREFQTEPAAETQALARVVRARVAAVSVPELASGVAPVGFAQAPLPVSRRWSRGRVAVLGAGLGLAFATAVAWWPSKVEPVDGNLVAVAPFRVSSPDSALGYLREGMMDLLAAELTGEGGPRALDPRMVLHSWTRIAGSPAVDPPRKDALGLAKRLGAGQLIQGGIVGDRRHLIMTASLLSVPGGSPVTLARVEGPADSIAELADRLTAQLLARAAGEREPRLAAVTSLPSLRAYLEGRAALRAGRPQDAARQFDRALDLDSTFALAGMGLLSADEWRVFGPGDLGGSRGSRLAWAARDRLGRQDRAILTAWIGPHYPAPSSGAEVLAARQAAVEVAPDRMEAWYLLGDLFFHDGDRLGLDRPRERAAAAFRRALELDTLVGVYYAYPEPISHLFDIALEEHDLAAARRWLALDLADSTLGPADAYRWQLAAAAGDTAGLTALRSRFERMDEASLARILGASQASGLGLADAEQAAEVLERRVGTLPQDDNGVPFATHELWLNLGRPSQALAAVARMQEPGFLPHLPLYFGVLDRMFWAGDSASAESAAARLAGFAAQPMPRDSAAQATRSTDLCALGLWWMASGSRERAERALQQIETIVPGGGWFFTAGDKAVCSGMIRGWLAQARGRPAAPALARRLDSLLATDPPTVWPAEAGLVCARLLESAGDTAGALRAIRRSALSFEYRTTFLREEGRLASLTGDTAGAARAYRRYLAFRWAPEPVLQPEAARIREELARLQLGSGRTRN
jgi:DNA-binding SARP family transcriptional activator